jgi:serine protease
MTKSRMARTVAVLATALSTMSAMAVVPSTPASAVPAVELTDQLIVKYRAGATSATPQTARWSALAGEPLGHHRAFGADGHVMKLRGMVPLARAQALAARLAADPDVEYAEADQMMQPTALPNDPQYSNQWGYFAPTPGLMGANLAGAWDLTTGSSSIYIAVIDTGIRPHADLVGRYVGGYDFISGSLAVANDGDLRDNDPSDPGDWVTSQEAASGTLAGCPVRSSSWHGTHVAGTVAAATHNAFGVAGSNWVSQVVPVRVLGKCGGYTSDIVDGMRWAAGLSVSGVPSNPYAAKVLNLSLGGSGACTSTYQNAITEITAAGAVVVVAAGNSNANASNYSPASCAGVLTVAATGKVGNRAYYSNYGTSVEIAAPGGDANADGSNGTILSTLNAGTTTPGADALAYYQGTSMATPHVAGIVSLMLSRNPGLTPAQVTQILQATVTAFPAGSSCTTSLCGAGIVNAAAAVAMALNPPAPTAPGPFGKSSPANGATKRATTLTLSWGASSGAASYEYCVSTSNGTCSAGWTSVGTATSATTPKLSAKTLYYWQVRASNAGGQTNANGGTWWRFTTR